MLAKIPLKVIEEATRYMLKQGWSSEYIGWCVGPDSGAIEYVVRNPGISAEELAQWGMEKISSKPATRH